MTVKSFTDVYLARPCYIAFTYLGKVDVVVPSNRKVGEVASAPRKVFHTKYECFSYPSGGKETKTDSPVSDVHHKSTSDLLG